MKGRMKRAAALLLSGTMVFSLAACGGSGESKEEVKDGNAKDQVTIKIAWWGSDTRHEYTQKMLDLYEEENPNVKFEASPAGWDGYFEKLSTQAASGSMPDIVQMDYQYISTYSKNGSLADLSEYVEDGTIDASTIDDSILNTGKINDKLTGVPISTSIMAVTYNPVAIEAAGAEMPTEDWTWDDYIELNKKVSEYTGQESALSSITGPFGDMSPIRYWVREKGAELFNEDGTALGYDDDQIVADYFHMWKDMVDADIAPDPDEQAQLETLGKESLPILEGKAATTTEWNNFPSMMSGSNDNLKLQFMPGAKDSGALWLKPGMFLSVSETSKVKEECAKFIDWFLNSEEANDIMMAERGTPTSGATREYMVESGKLTDQQIEMFEYTDKVVEIAGECPPAEPNGIAELIEAFSKAGTSVMYDEATAEEAAATFRKQATEILERNNGK